MVSEQWKPVIGWEPYYEVSSLGRIRRIGGKVRAQYANPDGYRTVAVSGGGARKTLSVHAAVVEAFSGPRPPGLVCRHMDGNPANNVAGNLQWGTQSENQYDKRGHGTDHEANKVACPRGHVLCEPNLRPAGVRNGQRICLACDRARAYCRKYDLWPRIDEIANDRYAKIMQEVAPRGEHAGKACSTGVRLRLPALPMLQH